MSDLIVDCLKILFCLSLTCCIYMFATKTETPICVPGQKLHIPEVGDCYVFTPGNYYPNGERK